MGHGEGQGQGHGEGRLHEVMQVLLKAGLLLLVAGIFIAAQDESFTWSAVGLVLIILSAVCVLIAVIVLIVVCIINVARGNYHPQSNQTAEPPVYLVQLPTYGAPSTGIPIKLQPAPSTVVPIQPQSETQVHKKNTMGTFNGTINLY